MLIDHAFIADVPTAEKLVLLFLASRANAVGVGAWDRALLERATGYKRRSVQRLLKSLRDAGLLVDIGHDWYRLDLRPTVLPRKELQPHQELTLPPGDELPDPPAPGSIMTLAECAAAEGGQAAAGFEHEAQAAGEMIAAKMLDASDYLMDQLAAFESRFAAQIDRLAMLHVEHSAPAPEPPPDPVKESELYRRLAALGVDEAEAYRLAQAELEQLAAAAVTAPESDTIPPDPPAERELPTGMARDPDIGMRYTDSAAGRALRIAHLLEGQDRELSAVDLKAWAELEAGENQHSIDGEVPAFEQLYPAIAAAARQHAGRMTFAQFIAPEPIADGRAPWDMDPAPTPDEDAVLAAEVQKMLGELNAANDPRCAVQPRTVETLEDGTKRTETMLGYYRRVRGKWQQRRKLKEMGVI